MASLLKYSNLGKKETAQILYNNIWASQITVAKRNQLKHGMDDFTNFSWRSIDAFENFGAFIINNKNSLKFYNGSTYSNQYTKPQFESSTGNLTGISFNTPKIDFTIGAYWISEDDLRQLIYWLNPYEISALTFDFEPFYFYQVKLASVEQGIRYIVGIEKNYDQEGELWELATTIKPNTILRIKHTGNNSDNYAIDGKIYKVRKNRVYQVVKRQNSLEVYSIGLANEKDYRYYTEFKVSFEVQGPACAYHKMAYEFDIDESTTTSTIKRAIWTVNSDALNQIGNSHLEMPFNWFINFNLTDILPEDFTYSDDFFAHLVGAIKYEGQDQKVLFDINLTNLSFLSENRDGNPWELNLKYDSSVGLMFLELGNSEHLLLSRISTVSTGKRIVDNILVRKHFITGTFDSYLFDLGKTELSLEVSFVKDGNLIEISDSSVFHSNIAYLDMRARTNLI